MAMDENIARELLMKEEVFSLRELKTAFRNKAMVEHPDHGGDAERFIHFQDAFELLKDFATEGGRVKAGTETEDGTLLSTLGNGYPLTVSAKTCEVCEGRGYNSFPRTNENKEVACPDCQGTGAFSYACRGCWGTGSNTSPRDGKVIGKCNMCGGSGRFYPPYKGPRVSRITWIPVYKDITLSNGQKIRANACSQCESTGRIWVTVRGTERFYAKCNICSGVGEVKIYNPVIPRGLFAVST